MTCRLCQLKRILRPMIWWHYKQLLKLLAVLLGIHSAAFALGPHEILILANGREPDSVEVAKHYARLRQVPECNIVVLQMPASIKAQAPGIKPEDFTRLIWTPATQVAKARGLDDHILAWVYSTHFPIRTYSQPSVSLQGLTFMRNHMPESKVIGDGSYHSPLFAGPDKPRDTGYAPQSFGAAAELLRREMPLPSMTLGYTGERGNTKAEVIACLEKGKRSDYTQPTGSIYFVTSGDVRSVCRRWQFADAVRNLKRMGVQASVGDTFPKDKTDVMGVMMGSQLVKPETVGRFLPGCMAEHLTSFAAAFDYKTQTKISRWIAAGVTASAGAVCEPMSIWAKFPNARFYNHYASGCTVIESFYQSIRCPFQIMLVGDPLAAPWASSPATLDITGLKAGDLVSGPRSIQVGIESKSNRSFRRVVHLIDGRIAGEGRTFTLSAEGLKPGTHTLRIVAYETGLVQSQSFLILPFKTQ